MRPNISIIVPIYNVEKCLPKCINSLVNQTMENIEILLIDDGSLDNSGIIADKYAENDNRIKVIHKENGGLSDARNVGLREATGQYILFVDSDDYICKDACEILYSYAVKDSLDIVIGDAIKIEINNETLMSHAEISQNKILSGQEFMKEQLRKQHMLMAAWLNLYKRDFLIDNCLYFKKGILHEDEQWTPRVFLKATKVSYVRYPFYYYIIRVDSITNSKDKTKNGIDLINTCYELEKIYNSLDDRELKELLNDYLVMLFLNAIHVGNLYSRKYNNLYSKRFLLGKSKTIKNKIKSSLFIINKYLYKHINNVEKYLKKSYFRL